MVFPCCSYLTDYDICYCERVSLIGVVVSLEEVRTRKEIKSLAGERGVTYEVYLSVLKYVYQYIPVSYEEPMDYLYTKKSLTELFEGNQQLFSLAFYDLLQYWGLTQESKRYDPHSFGLQTYETIGDLCLFLSKQVN